MFDAALKTFGRVDASMQVAGTQARALAITLSRPRIELTTATNLRG